MDVENSVQATNLLIDAIDIHVHSYPSIFERSIDDFELVEKAAAFGMQGVVLKSHNGNTGPRAIITQKHIKNRIKVFGSIVLNHYTGGLNPFAVDTAIKLGAKIIFMPTTSSENHRRFYGGSQYKSLKTAKATREPSEGITILDENDNIKKSVIDILEIISCEDVCLATGHLSNDEGLLLCEKALSMGVKKIIFTHPDFETNRLSLEKQIELAKKGVFIEKTMLSMTKQWNCISLDATVKSIEKIGAEQCILSSDFGQKNNIHPVDGMALYIEKMLQKNVSSIKIKKMVCSNPMKILGLNE